MFSGKPGFRVRLPDEEVPGLHLWKPEETPGLHLWRPQEEAEERHPEIWRSPGEGFRQGPFDNLAFRFGGGLAGAALPPASHHPSLEDVEPDAAGDLMCKACKGGRPSGMTGAYRYGGDALCAKCIVKRLGYENVPSSELPGLLEPWTLRQK